MKREKKKETLNSVADELLSSVKSALKGGKSPVTGSKFVPLSKEYAKLKQKIVGNKSANLILMEDMVSSLKTKISGNKITIGIFGDTLQKKKAFNHTVGDTLPRRPLLPNTSSEVTLKGKGGLKQFDKELVLDRIKRIINDARKSEE